MIPGTRIPGLAVTGISHRYASSCSRGNVAWDTLPHLLALEVQDHPSFPQAVRPGQGEPMVCRRFHHPPHGVPIRVNGVSNELCGEGRVPELGRSEEHT